MNPSSESDVCAIDREGVRLTTRSLLLSEKEPVTVSRFLPCDDRQARIVKWAYALYAEHGYREGYALDDWCCSVRSSVSNVRHRKSEKLIAPTQLTKRGVP